MREHVQVAPSEQGIRTVFFQAFSIVEVTDDSRDSGEDEENERRDGNGCKKLPRQEDTPIYCDVGGASAGFGEWKR